MMNPQEEPGLGPGNQHGLGAGNQGAPVNKQPALGDGGAGNQHGLAPANQQPAGHGGWIRGIFENCLRLVRWVFAILDVLAAISYIILTPVEMTFFVSPPHVLFMKEWICLTVRGGATLYHLYRAVFPSPANPDPENPTRNPDIENQIENLDPENPAENPHPMNPTLRLILLILDLFAVLPYGIIASALQFHLVIPLLALRILQLRRYHQWHDIIGSYLRSRTLEPQRSHVAFFCLLAVRFMRVLLLDLYWVHIAGCVLYFTAAAQEDREHSWLGSVDTVYGIDFTHFWTLPFWTLYSTSTYFSAMTVTTVGYGDIHPTTLLEGWVVKVLMLITGIIAVVSSYMLSNVLDKISIYRKNGLAGVFAQ